MAALGLCSCSRVFSSCGDWRLLFVAVGRLLIVVVVKWYCDNSWHASASHFLRLSLALGWNEIQMEEAALIISIILKVWFLEQQHWHHLGTS